MKKLFFLIALLSGAATAPAFAGDVEVSTDWFDLANINPSIYNSGTCTYDEEKQAYFLQTGQYGFGGWEYETPIDLSGYSKIVIELEEAQYDGAQFRLCTEKYDDSYEAIYSIGSGKSSLTIDLTNMESSGSDITIGENFDLTSIAKAGFWTYGPGDNNDDGIYIKSVTLYENGDDEDGNTDDGESNGDEVAVSTDWFNLETLDPTIYGEGTCTYDEEKEAYCLLTSQYGFGGWEYETPIDLSGYTKIVIELAEGETDNASFRLFDEKSYWSDCATFDMEYGSSTLTVDLSNVTKEVTTTGEDGNETTETVDVDLTHIYRVGFWTNGSSAIYIKSVTLYKNAGDDEDGNTDDGESNGGEVAVSTDWFDLDQIDANLYGSGGSCEYNEEKQAYFLQTAQYGFGGWKYDPAIDLSGYSKIVIELEEAQYDGAEFRLCTEKYDDSYEAICSIGSGKSSLTIDLTNLVTDSDNGITIGDYFDLSSIAMAGFWTYGAGDSDNGIYIKSITLYKYEGIAVSVTLNRDPDNEDTYYGTFSNASACQIAGDAGIVPYYATGETTSEGTTYITLKAVEAEEDDTYCLSAGTGYLLKATGVSDGDETKTYESAVKTYGYDVTAPSGNRFTACLEGITATDSDDIWVLSYVSNDSEGGVGVGFYKLEDGGTLGAGKAYLTGLGSSAGVKMSFGDLEEGETTGITSVSAGAKTDGYIYDIAGRRVSAPAKGGVYIKNGKKVVY